MNRVKSREAQVYTVTEADRCPGGVPGVGYARLSKDPGRDLVAVNDQIAAMLREARATGVDLLRIWFDDDLSAWRLDVHRPSWHAYLADLATGTLRVAMTYHSDRLVRNGTDGEAFLTIAHRHDLALVSPGKRLDLGDADARFTARINFAVAIKSSDDTSRRLRDRKDEARRRGNLRYVFGSRPPLGFETGEADWQTETGASLMLTDVARRVLAGESLSRAFAAQAECWLPAYTTRAGTLPAIRVTEKMVRAALTRPATAGLMTDRDGAIMAGVVTTCARDGQTPPLDPDLWRALQPRFIARKRQGDQPRADYPHGRNLACEVCGNQLSGELTYDRRMVGGHWVKTAQGKRRKVGGTWQVVKTSPAYRCKNRHLQPDGTYNTPCRRVGISAEAVDRVLGELVVEWSQTSPRYTASAVNLDDLSAREAELVGAREAEAEVAKALAANLAGKILPLAGYNAAMATVAANLAAIEAELADLAAARVRPAADPITLEGWAAMTAERKRALVADAFVTPIRVTPGKGGACPVPAADRLLVDPLP